MPHITKIHLINFKKFQNVCIPFKKKQNILIGDNEAGKSSVLKAIELVLKGNPSKILDLGLENLFNSDTINDYMAGDRNMENLPEMIVDLYFDDSTQDMYFHGEQNQAKDLAYGISFRCKQNDEFSEQISQVLKQPGAGFPFEFYKCEFQTFAGYPYNRYKKLAKITCIDNSQIGNPYTINEFVRSVYENNVDDVKRIELKQAYHSQKETFKNDKLQELTLENAEFSLALKDSVKNNLETDITVCKNNIPIESHGTGIQCFLKTELALSKLNEKNDVILLEEPENHLSYTNMLKLISKIQKSVQQTFISSHSDLISTRLNLKNCILLNSQSSAPVLLSDLSEDTANFFMKAPDNNMLQFVMSKKAILVEGDAEYILMDRIFKLVTQTDLESSNISVIAVDGKCFKRYLEIAKILNIKTAVITDNDGDYEKNITKNYEAFVLPDGHVKIFADENNNRNTFEVCVYQDNARVCDSLFKTPQRTLEIQDYMIKNKAEAAFALSQSDLPFIVPQYIKAAIEWINQ